MNCGQVIVSFILGCVLIAAPLARAAEQIGGTRPASAPASAQASAVAPAPAAVEQRANYSFRAAPIEEVFDMLSQKDKLNIVLTRGVTGPITVNLYNTTVKEAIYSIAEAAGYWVEVRNGSYVILGKESSVDYPGANTVVKSFKVQYSDPKQVSDLLAKYISRYGKITPLIGRKLIVVEDLPGYMDRIQTILQSLDVQPKQIMIEARILEVTLDAGEQYGVDWRRVFGSPSNTNLNGSFGNAGLATGTAAAPATGFFFSLLNQNLEVYFSALASKGLVRTLATPKLLAMENEEATAVIGEHTGYSVTTTINLVTSQTIQFLDSGVILKVTPSVDEQGRVLLKVHPEVSSATLSAAGVPSKKSTEVTTSLLCEDGQSIFIGGLINAQSSNQRNGIPILGEMPILGNFFSSKNETVNSKETVVIITPYVIKDAKDAERFAEEKLRQTERASSLINEREKALQRVPGSFPTEGTPAEIKPGN